MNKHIVTRFAPSPTGYLHVGSLRTALFNYLWARKNNGSFRLRIEDTDKKRTVSGADTALIKSLTELGLAPDEMIVYQSKRVDRGIYKERADYLIAHGHAYHCFCSPERLEEVRKVRTARKEPPGYDGTCRSLDPAESEKRTKNESSVVRIKWEHSENEVLFVDELHGDVRFATKNLEDTIILKSDGFPTYHLSNVIDDHEMRITDVIRGEEWLPSAPIHALLYKYFNYELPRFWHLPLILNPDKTKLSKRQGDVTVEAYLEKGYLKEAIINYIASLGWNPGDERELYSLEELTHEFDLKKINTSAAIFDIQKLNWYNSEYIKHNLAPKDDEQIYMTIKPFLPKISEKKALQIFSLFFERIHNLTDLAEMSSFLIKLPAYDSANLVFKKSSVEKTKHGLAAGIRAIEKFTNNWTAINLDLALKNEMEAEQLSFGDVFWPIRVALSGLTASPPPTEIMEYLEKEESLKRLKYALKHLM